MCRSNSRTDYQKTDGMRAQSSGDIKNIRISYFSLKKLKTVYYRRITLTATYGETVNKLSGRSYKFLLLLLLLMLQMFICVAFFLNHNYKDRLQYFNFKMLILER